MFIDSHAHFSPQDGDEGFATVLPRAWAAGVDRVVAIGGSEPLNAGGLAAAAAFPDRVCVALGFGRDLAPELTANGRLSAAMGELDARLQAHAGQVVAIGEIGLDYHYTPETAPAQRALFGAQLALARTRGLPAVVHSRDADEDTVAALKAFAVGEPYQPLTLPSPPRGEGRESGGRGVLHCFTGGEAFAQALLEIGFYISFSGIVTFRNADALRAVARKVPADRLLIETDSPYLAPVPLRGKRNEPAFVRHVAEAVAEARSCGVEEIARLTSENARRLFGL